MTRQCVSWNPTIFLSFFPKGAKLKCNKNYQILNLAPYEKKRKNRRVLTGQFCLKCHTLYETSFLRTLNHRKKGGDVYEGILAQLKMNGNKLSERDQMKTKDKRGRNAKKKGNLVQKNMEKQEGQIFVKKHLI